MCRALLVLCVAPDHEALGALKRATVSASWELTPGATTAEEALSQLEDRRPNVLVVQGPWPGLVERARAVLPALRVVALDDHEPRADATAAIDGVREAILGLPPPGGPVRAPSA